MSLLAGINQAFQENAGVINMDKHMQHVDHRNPHTFEIEDLAKLIKQVQGSYTLFPLYTCIFGA